MAKTRRILTLGAGALAALASISIAPAIAAPTYPPLTLDKTNAISTSAQGDSVVASGDGCPVGDGAEVSIYKGTIANDATFLSIASEVASTGNAGLVDGTGHASATLSIPGGAYALATGIYSIRLACYQQGVSYADGYDVLFETRQITINGAGVTTTTATTDPPTSSASTPTTAAPTTTVPAPAATPAPAVAAQPTYTG